VYPPTRSITASKCISEFTLSRPPSASPNSLNHGFQVHLLVHLILASKCINQTHSITASKCISEFTRSLGLQVHLQTRSSLASKCISEFTRSQSPSASPNTLDRGFQVDLQDATAVVRRYRGNGGGQSDGEYIFGRPRKTSSHFHLILSYNDNTLYLSQLLVPLALSEIS